MGRCVKSQTASSSLTCQGFQHIVLEIFRELICIELPLSKPVMNLEPCMRSGPHEHHRANLRCNCRCTCIQCPWHCCRACLTNCCESSLPGSLALVHWSCSSQLHPAFPCHGQKDQPVQPTGLWSLSPSTHSTSALLSFADSMAFSCAHGWASFDCWRGSIRCTCLSWYPAACGFPMGKRRGRVFFCLISKVCCKTQWWLLAFESSLQLYKMLERDVVHILPLLRHSVHTLDTGFASWQLFEMSFVSLQGYVCLWPKDRAWHTAQ